MAFCNKCGAQIPDTAKFCNKCGIPVKVTWEEAAGHILEKAKSETFSAETYKRTIDVKGRRIAYYDIPTNQLDNLPVIMSTEVCISLAWRSLFKGLVDNQGDEANGRKGLLATTCQCSLV